MDYTITKIGPAQIHIIKPLWEKLNRQHYDNSENFKQHYAEQTFERRFEKFTRLPEDELHIEAAIDRNGTPVGYCICSVHCGEGELDSIYIEPAYRKQALGSVLARRGVEWLKKRGFTDIRVSVADGNEGVFPFCESLGFRKRLTVFQLAP